MAKKSIIVDYSFMTRIVNDLDSKNLEYLEKMLARLNDEYKTIMGSDNHRGNDVLDNIRKTEEVMIEINKIERPRATSFARKLLSKNSKTI